MTPTAYSQKFVAVAIVFGIVGVFALCVGGLSWMNMDTMTAPDCPITHQTKLCPVAAVEHLSVWQQALIPRALSSTILALVLILATLTVRFRFNLSSTTASPPHLWQQRFDLLVPGFDYLTRQFSQGILHPKIY